MGLTSEQVDRYRTDGWLAPLDVMTPAEAALLANRLEDAEAAHPEHLHASNRNNAHLTFPFLADLANHPAIIDAVRCLVGEDLSLWSTVLFIKEPNSSAFVSWHQDAHYMALEPDNFVTAWVAVTPSTLDTGCVSVLPGTHTTRFSHSDTFADDNILTRGQQVEGVDTSNPVHLELEPGQMSLHHPWLVHGSQPNRSNHRRVGVAMQAYLGRDVRPLRGRHHVMHIAGELPAPAFHVALRPTETCSPSGVEARSAANHAFADVLYDGAVQRRSL